MQLANQYFVSSAYLQANSATTSLFLPESDAATVADSEAKGALVQSNLQEPEVQATSESESLSRYQHFQERARDVLSSQSFVPESLPHSLVCQ